MYFKVAVLLWAVPAAAASRFVGIWKPSRDIRQDDSLYYTGTGAKMISQYSYDEVGMYEEDSLAHFF